MNTFKTNFSNKNKNIDLYIWEVNRIEKQLNQINLILIFFLIIYLLIEFVSKICSEEKNEQSFN